MEEDNKKGPATTAEGFDPIDREETGTDQVAPSEEIPGGAAEPVPAAE